MRPGKRPRRVTGLVSAALVSAVISINASQTDHSHEVVDSWYNAAAPAAAKEYRGVRASAPEPPSVIELLEASDDGVAKGLELAALSEGLLHTLKTGSLDGEEALQLFHHSFCLAIVWLLNNKVDPGSPTETGRVIDRFLVVDGLPNLDYETEIGPLNEVWRIIKWGLSSDELSRKVADAACDAA